MTDTDTSWNALPAVVTAYLNAHRSRDVADLHYRFALDGDLISALVIEP